MILSTILVSSVSAYAAATVMSIKDIDTMYDIIPSEEGKEQFLLSYAGDSSFKYATTRTWLKSKIIFAKSEEEKEFFLLMEEIIKVNYEEKLGLMYETIKGFIMEILIKIKNGITKCFKEFIKLLKQIPKQINSLISRKANIA